MVRRKLASLRAKYFGNQQVNGEDGYTPLPEHDLFTATEQIEIVRAFEVLKKRGVKTGYSLDGHGRRPIIWISDEMIDMIRTHDDYVDFGVKYLGD